MDLDQIQRTMMDATRQPLTARENMRQRTTDGRSLRGVAESIIKRNDRLSSFERLEIYNRQYWFRVLSALAEDFEGLRLILGDRTFEKMSIAYLQDCPSQSFTLRNLGSRLEEWLRAHREFVAGVEEVSLDMVRLEWADIEAFDEGAFPQLTESDMAMLGPNPQFKLQPYVRLLELEYPVDAMLLVIRSQQREFGMVSSAMEERPQRRRSRKRALPKPEKVFLAVHRADNSVYFKRLDPDAFGILSGLRDGKRLSEALEYVNWSDGSGEQASENLQAWFALWSSLGWFCK
jgi:Putative DNA-binding domain